MTEFIGQKQEELLLWLKDTWLTHGPNICAVEGFPGVGKSWVVRSLLAKMPSNFKYVRIDYPEGEANQLDDFILDMAESLQEEGFPQMAQAVDEGVDHSGLLSELTAILHQPVLLVVDEFQRALEPLTSHIKQPLSRWLYNFSQSQLPGRVLLLTNVRLQRIKTTNSFDFQYLPELSPPEAEELLERFLERVGQQGEVPEERRRDVVQALGCNPAALQVLTSCLTYEPLRDLIGAMPDVWEVKDREISPDLLHRLQIRLMARTLDHLETPALEIFKILSVYRKPVKREAFRELAGGDDPDLREALARRLLLKQHLGWFTPQPVVREVVRHRLESSDLQHYHSLAGNYYARHFHARQIVGGGALGGQFAEARYHLFWAGRLEELGAVTSHYVSHLKAIFLSTSPVPQDKGELDERIAMLQGLLEKAGAKGLEYYLARCLLSRNRPGDRQTALNHVRRAIGPAARADTWVLCISLEAEFGGIETGLSVFRESLKYITPDKNLFSLYLAMAALLGREDHADEAIDLLSEGIGKIPADKGLAALFQAAAELLGRKNRVDEAIGLLREGIVKIPPDQSLMALYQAAAELLGRENRVDEAIDLLREGIGKIPPGQSLVDLYRAAAELLGRENRVDEAIGLLREGIGRISPDKNLYGLYQAAAEILNHHGRLKEALSWLRQGWQSIPVGKFSRPRLFLVAIYILAAERDLESIQSLLSGKGPDVMEPHCAALCQAMQLQIRDDWGGAANAATTIREKFSNFMDLAIQEAFSWLAAGDAAQARKALDRFPHEIRDKMGSGNTWLKATIALKQGGPDKAKQYLSIYLGRDPEAIESCEMQTLLRIWDEDSGLFVGNPSYYFPNLPPSLTGFSITLTRRQYGPGVLAQSAMAEPPEGEVVTIPAKKAYLALCTEWFSKHGGVSTFNRELCKALAAAGHRVACVVPKASSEEKEHAAEVQVHLIEAIETPGLGEEALLCQRPKLPEDFSLQYIIGHDRITGPAAKSVQDHFPGVRRIQIIHTAPAEIEWFKDHPADQGAAATADSRRELQKKLAVTADLVVAVGPRLYREFADVLSGLREHPPFIQLIPGLGELEPDRKPNPQIVCLILGRAEDLELKGLDIAAKAMALLEGIHPPPILEVRGAPPGEGEKLRQKLLEIGDRPGQDIRPYEYSSEIEKIQEDLRRASLLLMPSRKEGFGLVGMEAITMGTPILISDKSGLGELTITELGDEAWKYVAPVTGDLTQDGPAWKEKIYFVLADRQAAFARAKALRQKLQDKLSWPEAVATLLKALDDL